MGIHHLQFELRNTHVVAHPTDEEFRKPQDKGQLWLLREVTATTLVCVLHYNVKFKQSHKQFCLAVSGDMGVNSSVVDHMRYALVLCFGFAFESETIEKTQNLYIIDDKITRVSERILGDVCTYLW